MNAKLQNRTDEELYRLLQEGGDMSMRAFDEIYSRYSSKIYTYCRKVLYNAPAADDVFQEVFTRVFENAKNDREMTNLSGFIIRVARNLCLNEKDKKSNQGLLLDDFQFPVYDKSFEKKEINDIMNIALDTLPEKYREVLILKEFLDMSYQEISDTLGDSLPVVRIRIYRAKNKLREILEPYFEEYEKNKLDESK